MVLIGGVKIMHKIGLFRGFLFILLVLPVVAVAQTTTLSGAIVIGKAEVMSYQLVYEVDGHGRLSGYSVSDVNGTAETKARITGSYNNKDKTLKFEETAIISTRMRIPYEEFCLMKVSGRIENKGGKPVFNGEFTSAAKSSDIECEPGTLLLLSEKSMEALSRKVPDALKKTEKSDSLQPAGGTSPPVRLPAARIIELEGGMEKEFVLRGREVQLDLVDDRFQDGDKVTLLLNQKVLAKNLEITNKVKTFKLTPAPGENDLELVLLAEDEGSISLTTVRASLRQGDEVQMLMFTLNKGESVRLSLRRR